MRIFFAEVLKRERERQGLSQEDLATKLAIDARTIRDWEGGRHKPRVYLRKKLQDLFALTAEEFGLIETDEMPTHALHGPDRLRYHPSLTAGPPPDDYVHRLEEFDLLKRSILQVERHPLTAITS